MAADQQRRLFQLFLLISSSFFISSYAYQFKVGGRQGWVVNPYENYNTWAERMRFQVNDTLLFKYSKGDSVLVVNKDDYDKCNTDKPIVKFDDGNSIFKFDRSGPFYFITGNKANCEKGQKMIIVVLAIRNPPPLPTPPTLPSPPGQSPTASPPTGTSPISPSPSPSGGGGTTTPALSPAPALSPTGAKPPSVSPTPAGSPMSPSPTSQTPVPSPEGLTPAPVVTPTSSSPSPSPVSSPPSPLSPSTNTPGSPALSPSGGGTAGAPTSGNTPSDIRSPTGSPAGSAATQAFTPSAVLFSTVSHVLCGIIIFI